MRIASVTPNHLAVVTDESFIRIGDTLVTQGLLPKGAAMIDFIANYQAVKSSKRKSKRSAP